MTLLAMSLGYGVVQLDVTIVNVAIGSIGHSFETRIAALQWVVTAYTLSFAALILTAGSIGDRVGAKRVFAWGFAIFTAASLACAMVPTLPLLIACRLFQGVGAAALVPNSLSLLNHAYPQEHERGWAVAVWAAGATVALTAGPLVGGSLIAVFGWRAIFLVNVPIGLSGIYLAARYTTETPSSSERHFDVAGQLAAIVSLGCLSGALIEGGERGWSNPLVLLGFAVAVLALVTFIRVESRIDEPMLRLSLFRRRAFTLSSALGLMVNIAFYGLFFVLSLYLQQSNRFSPLLTGLAFIPMLGAVLPANLLVPKIASDIGARKAIAAGAAIMAIACFALLNIAQGTSYPRLVGQFIALGFGLGLLVPPLTSMLLGSVERSQSGVASGVFNSMRQIGSVVGVALFGAIIASSHLVAGLHVSLGISALLLSISSVIIAFSRQD